MEDFFGGSLLIKDAFSSTLTKFGEAVDSSSNKFKMFTKAIGESERANRLANQNMKSQIAQLSQDYAKQGYTMGQALRKATGEVSKGAPKSGNAWVDAFGKMKQAGTDAFGGIASKVQSFSNSSLGMITKLTGGFLSFKAAEKGLNTGFKTAMEFQDSRMTLDTLYGSSTKGGQKFKMATDFANETPWEESETVGSLVKMKAYGLDDSKKMMTMMSDLGATFKSMGQNMDTATEAYADMMNGQWERMTSFGIKRETLDKFAKDKGMKAFDNKQGQITDKNALASTFEAYMKDKNYTGMTDKLSQTASGKLSTMTGNFKKSLGELVGITEEGGVRDGSLFDRFINGMDSFITKMNSFAGSENFTKISNALGDIGGAVSSAFGFIAEHPEIASTLLKVSVGLWGLSKAAGVVSTVTTLVKAFGEGGLLAKVGMALLPLAPAIAVVGGGFMALSSILSPGGVLNQAIGSLLGKAFGKDVQDGWNENTKAVNGFFGFAADGLKNLFGFESDEELVNKYNKKNQEIDNNWYGGPDGKTLIKDNSYKTASDMAKDGSIGKDSSSSYNNKNEVNVNIAKVEKDVDIDQIGDALVKKIDKYSQTRNNLDY